MVRALWTGLVARGGLAVAIATAGNMGCVEQKPPAGASTPSSHGSQGHGGQSTAPTGTPNEAAPIEGAISMDGSSTVFPIAAAWAEEFESKHPKAKGEVAKSGTSSGFKKFIAGEVDIANASRAISEKEIELLKEKQIDWTSFTVAMDGMSVVVHPENTWAAQMTVDELKKIWAPDSMVKKWNEVRSDWPDLEIQLFAPGRESGTFEFFCEAVLGTKKQSRTDATLSEDDNTLVQGVSGSKGAIGYFGYSYYAANAERLKAVAIAKTAEGPFVKPSIESIRAGEYLPLTRPLFIYVRNDALAKPVVAKFVEFALSEAGQTLVEAPTVGYVRIDEKTIGEMRAKLAK